MTAPLTHSRRTSTDIRRGVAIAALIIGVTVAAKILWPGTDWSERAAMGLSGVALIILGNAIPKTLTPLAVQRCEPSRLQRLQRLAGWTWVATGAALAAVWLFVPVGIANTVTMLVVPAALLVNVVQLLRIRRGPGAPRTSDAV